MWAALRPQSSSGARLAREARLAAGAGARERTRLLPQRPAAAAAGGGAGGQPVQHGGEGGRALLGRAGRWRGGQRAGGGRAPKFKLWVASMFASAWQAHGAGREIKALFFLPSPTRTAWLPQRWTRRRALLPSRPWPARTTPREKSEPWRGQGKMESSDAGLAAWLDVCHVWGLRLGGSQHKLLLPGDTCHELLGRACNRPA